MGLERLDTVLAFVAVMLVLSLLITIGVQMVIAVLGLRAGNLKLGILEFTNLRCNSLIKSVRHENQYRQAYAHWLYRCPLWGYRWLRPSIPAVAREGGSHSERHTRGYQKGLRKSGRDRVGGNRGSGQAT